MKLEKIVPLALFPTDGDISAKSLPLLEATWRV